ncbi:hypothetical protein SUGI_0963520 [Cryptomeria japonica]|nr:hypothetical protein SUGI_0963520 [Cryptomeria japonica]
MERVNEIVMRIQCCGGTLSKDKIVSKVLRALPPAYKMKATAINELRTMVNTFVNIDTLVGKLSSFELEEFGPSGAVKTEPAFHAFTSTIGKQNSKALYAKELEDMKREDDEFEKLEALFARRVPKGPTRSNGSDNGKEWVFLAIKEDDLTLEENVPEEKALATKIEEKDEWVIDSGCSHHMTIDKGKFPSLQEFDGGLVRFGDDKACMIKGKGTISLDGKNNTDNVYYVEGLKHNLLSVGQLVDKGFQLQFKDGKCKIINRSRLEIATGTQTKGLKIKCLRSDHGGEFTSGEFNNFCDKHGIRRQFSAPRTPQQNGVVGRKNRTILDVARKMMMEANLPHIY